MVEIQTDNRILAAGCAAANPGATYTITAGVHSVTHSTKLVLPVDVAQRAGFSTSYTAWAEAIRAIVVQGHITLHDMNMLIIEDGEGEDASFVASYGPAKASECTASKVRVRQSHGIIGR